MLLFLHQVFGGFVQFAPLGLVNMYNSGGALENVTSTGDCSEITIQIQCRGPGRFGAYSATRPEICSVDEHEVEFKHTDDGFLAFDLSHGSSQDNLRNIEILYRASWTSIFSVIFMLFRADYAALRLLAVDNYCFPQACVSSELLHLACVVCAN